MINGQEMSDLNQFTSRLSLCFDRRLSESNNKKNGNNDKCINPVL